MKLQLRQATYYLQPDNRIVVGFQYNQWWYSCHAGVVLYLFDFARQRESKQQLQTKTEDDESNQLQNDCGQQNHH